METKSLGGKGQKLSPEVESESKSVKGSSESLPVVDKQPGPVELGGGARSHLPVVAWQQALVDAALLSGEDVEERDA